METELPSFEELKTGDAAAEPAERRSQRRLNKVQNIVQRRRSGVRSAALPPALPPDAFVPLESEIPKPSISPKVKFSQYRLCFPEETKQFKPLGKNATAEEWQELFDEMDLLVSCKGLQNYLENMIVAGVVGLETWFDENGEFDLRGASVILKSNPDFQQVCKRLYLKYNLFRSSPPELQLLILVATACMTAAKKNQSRRHLGELLAKEE